jgi:hypothetical protein
MEDKAKIIERVQKLLRMAADTSSPNEAAIAAGRARKLMDQHQLQMADLKEESGFGFEKIDKAYRFMPVWKNILSVQVAKFNDCKCSTINEWQTINQSWARRIMFQGYEADVAVGKAMFEYLVLTIDRLCQQYIAPLGYTRYPAKIGDAFKKSATMEVIKRMQAMQVERESELLTSAGTSLVLFKMAAVEAEFGKAKYVDKPLTTRRDAETFRAKDAGREAGRGISLNTQIGDPAPAVTIRGSIR